MFKKILHKISAWIGLGKRNIALYDKRMDILDINFNKSDRLKNYFKTVNVSNDVCIDVSEDGEIIGMEIYSASKLFKGKAKNVLKNADQIPETPLGLIDLPYNKMNRQRYER